MQRTGEVRISKYIMILALLAVALLFSFAVAETSPEFSIPAEITLIETEQAWNPAEGYIRQAMYSGRVGLLRISSPAGAALEGADAYLYQQLRTKVSAVAAGENNKTIFSFPVEDIYGKVRYTAADLGVESILVEEGGVWTVAPETVAAINTIIRKKFNQRDIIRCLLADCPYEMYWYDKTVGNITSFPMWSYSAEEVLLSGNVTFSMAVSEDYREEGKDPVEYIINNKKVYRYCYVGTQWGQSVKAAVQNARTIVAKYANLEDYDRLLAYKNEIRSMSSYNDEAAAGGVPFGNPWQLIWVFDGNPDTKVVCEGYSKAFQYLNDLSASRVTVICTTGSMNGRPHMWNIVTMDDGKKYMADITNCPDDAEYLFLAGYKSHDDTDIYGYEISGTQVVYIYDEDNIIYNENDLAVFDKGYLEAKPAPPVFTPGKNADGLRIGEELVFSLQENQGTEYDGFLVKITYIPEDPDVSGRINRESFEQDAWTFGPAFHEPGTYQVQFAGKCGVFTSLYSDPVVLNPVVTDHLGRLGFTEDTIDSFSQVLAGDNGHLEWNTCDEVNGYTIQLVEANGDQETVYEKVFDTEETETEFSWAYCPGTYVLHFVPDVMVGYAYSVDDPCEIIVKSSGKEWLCSDEGVLTRYFGSSWNVTVPAEINDREVLKIGPNAFDRSRARKVTVPSFVSVDVRGFSGDTKLNTVYGYENSDAESVAGTEGIQFISLGVKPGPALISLVSTGTGYPGYSVAVRLQQEADAVYIRETRDILPCEGLDILIPLDDTGVHRYTLAAIKDGVRGDFGDYISVDVNELEDGILEIPEYTQRIETEAFRGVQAAIVRIPGTVQAVGEKAFADNSKLQIVQTDNLGIVDEDLFDGSGQYVLCVEDTAVGFGFGAPFLVEP